MDSRIIKTRAERFFEEKDITYATNKNPQPNFAIRIGRRYETEKIDKLGKKIVPHFKKEISKFNKLIDFVIQ